MYLLLGLTRAYMGGYIGGMGFLFGWGEDICC